MWRFVVERVSFVCYIHNARPDGKKMGREAQKHCKVEVWMGMSNRISGERAW
jgi:hypothetical protein